MNVGELIKELQKYEQDLPAMVNGYEGGITEKRLKVELVSVDRDVNEEGYYGEHEEDFRATFPHDLAVLISRNG